MAKQLDTARKRPRIASFPPEFGDCRDVRRDFGLRESFTYHLWKTRQIKSVLLHGAGAKGTGKRLFDYSSIRALISKRQAEQDAQAEAK
jgi:hypothetical protein